MAIKTLHITNSYHPASGGIRTFYHTLLTAANRHRRFVRLVVPAAETSVEEVGEFGRIYHIAAPPSPVLDSRYRWLLPHTYAWPSDSTLRRILAAERPDLVEVCDKFWLIYFSGVLRRGWIPGVPVPVIVGLSCERLDDNVGTYISANRAAKYVCERYMRWCYAPRFDFHIAVSDYVAAEIRAALPERLNGRLVVAPMGVDYDSFSARGSENSFREQLLLRIGGGEKACLLLYAGRLSQEKNLAVLPLMLEILAEQKQLDYRLVIAGEGPLSEELRNAMDKQAPGRSLFLGHCQQADLVQLYHAADVFIHPNPREPFGIAPLEAMAAGLPLVAPASGGILTYANTENAWLTENTTRSFAHAVQRVHADPEACRQKTARARRTAERHSWRRITDDYFQLYDRLHGKLVQKITANDQAHEILPERDASRVGLSVESCEERHSVP
jgi:glycosyltransferase involved in cell wall biosynthesis